MRALRIIEVDASGNPIDGSELLAATPQAVDAGFMINEPVMLRYPDGRTVRSVEARVTRKGMAQAVRMMAQENGGMQ
ncbi:hypothetical protein [Paracoccus yeei]|uniref:hypothetical protein n=1 Tax=Paracoccus yeei TaxID=147645 RepID=UPI001D85A148|nr:hypothetical protein [Paracoccus yeei]